MHRRHGGRDRQPRGGAGQGSVFEFLLINHPLDCPVCDKGGECRCRTTPTRSGLLAAGWSSSAAPSTATASGGRGLRPTLMLNRNRCIMCTRCVRFMKEVDADAQIGVVDRGGHSQISTFGERGVHSLISGNLMDVCPVGAITTRDYRFKSRPGTTRSRSIQRARCARRLQHDGMVKAKPEWAKGARLIRFTPRSARVKATGCATSAASVPLVEGGARLTTPILRQASARRRNRRGVAPSPGCASCCCRW